MLRVLLPHLIILAVQAAFVVGATTTRADEQEIKFSDCPAPVRKALQAEAKGAKIDVVTKEVVDDEQPVFWAEAKIDGRLYAIGVLEDGTLSEMNLALDEAETTLDRCPAAVQETFRKESFGEKVQSIGMDKKYGVTIYETVVEHKGKQFEIVVAEDGLLVEKVLIVKDDEVTLDQCPPAVKKALREFAREGTIGDITRTTGLGRLTFEAEVKTKESIYLIEVAENGHLISKSLEAAEE